MKTKRGFRLRELGGDYILIGESAELINFNNLITFNEAAAYLWQQVEGKEFDVETLTQLLLAEYEVSEDVARKDAQATIEDWKAVGIIVQWTLRYSLEDARDASYRLKVKGGLTGYAQIVGKYNTSPKDKLVLDLMYIEKYSLWLDFKLIMQTVTVLFKAGDSTKGFGKAEKKYEFTE